MRDAHCHLDLCEDPAAAMAAGAAAGVQGWIVAGVDPEGWARQAAIAEADPRVSVSYGLHPWAAAAASDEQVGPLLEALDAALAGPVRPVGLGELGLDHGRRGPPPTRARQERAFRAQLAMARERDLPVILHLVAAPGRALEILRQDGLPAAGGMVHRWSGPAELVPACVKLGLHLSFSPAFLHSERLRAALVATPDHALLLETDAPDALPDGREVGLDFLPVVLAAAAEVRGESAEALAARCDARLDALFGPRRDIVSPCCS